MQAWCDIKVGREPLWEFEPMQLEEARRST
jgi:hypothetical protein